MVQSPKPKVQRHTSRRRTLDLGRCTVDFRRRTGSISLASLVAILLLAFLLGMVLNVARQVDNKIKLQNAADAATYSGGIVLTRGMNSLAFTNHLLCETLAMTAIMREGRDRHAEPLVPEILEAWNQMAPTLSRAPTLPDWSYPKFSAAGDAIPQKTPLEQQMVTRYGEWMAAASELLLPMLETILQQELIAQLQRDVVAQMPAMAQTATARIAEQHTGRPLPWDQGRAQIEAVLWRTNIDLVGGATESAQGTLPVVDPLFNFAYFNEALTQRNQLARYYLDLWNNVLMRPFDRYGRMSAFGGLWRGFTCGQLQQLLSEYSDSNLPHMIREAPPGGTEANKNWLNLNYQFVGVVYRRKVTAAVPRVFFDTLLADNQTFAQGMLFVPKRRPVDVGWWWNLTLNQWQPGWIKGELWKQQRWGEPSQQWDLWNQGWTFQLVPAVSPSIPSILSQQPQSQFISATNSQQLPNLSDVSSGDIIRLTTH
jgi:hypothetical protein